MTDQPTQDAIVSQRAREAYIAYASSTGRLRADLYGEAIMAGEWDSTPDLQAFARFEAEIEAATIERCAERAKCAFDDRPNSRSGHHSEMDWTDGYRDGTRAAEAAIRNLKGQTS